MRRFFSIILVLCAAAYCAAQVPASNHVVFLVEENQSYPSVIGSSAWPYLNSLAQKYGLATQYYANTHPSIGNYLEITTGQVLSNDDSQTPSSLPVSADNMVREILTAGKTWKSYAESLPSVGYTGGNTGNYLVRHNPFPYLTDVQNSASQKLNLVPFTQFATDLANNQLPDLSYIVPNMMDDAHNGTPQQADSWLQTNIAPLLANAAFQQDGILIITFDESVTSDTAHGGGQVATLVIGPQVKPGYKSTTLYQHQSLLRTVLTALGVTTFPSAAASAPDMGEFFNAAANPTASPTPSPAPAAPDFQVTAGPENTAAATSAGGQVSYQITITPQNGFSSAVSLSCTGLPAGVSCSFSPATLTPGAGAVNSTLTLVTNTVTSSLAVSRHAGSPSGNGLWFSSGSPVHTGFARSGGFFGLTLPFSAMAVGLVGVGSGQKKQRTFWLTLFLVIAIGMLVVGCGGGQGSNPASASSPAAPSGGAGSTAAQTYTVTVTASAGATQHSIPLQVSM